MVEEQEEVKIVLNKADKKQFRNNVIKLIIWVFLLILSRWYIQNHPAEKVSVFSGFDVLRQKVEVFFSNAFKWNWDFLESKYGLEKYYKELLNMAEWNWCVTSEQYKEISDIYERLNAESNDVLRETLPWYIEKAYQFDLIVKNNNC